MACIDANMESTEEVRVSHDENENSETESWEINEISYDSPPSNEAHNEASQHVDDDLKSVKNDRLLDIGNILLENSDASVINGHSSSNAEVNGAGSSSASSASVYLSEQSDDEISMEDEGSDSDEIILPVKTSPGKCESPSKWVPRISSVTRSSVSASEDTNKDNGHLVLIPEDTIKQEEFVDESEEYDGTNGKAASYANFSIKLEKLDFSDLRNEEIVQPSIKKRGRPSRARKVRGNTSGRKKGRSRSGYSLGKSKVNTSHPSEENNQVTEHEKVEGVDNRAHCTRTLRPRNIESKNSTDSDRRSLRLVGKLPKEEVLSVIKGKELKKKSNINLRDMNSGTPVEEKESLTAKTSSASKKSTEWSPVVKLKPIEALQQPDGSVEGSDSSAPVLKKKRVSFSNSNVNNVKKPKVASLASNKNDTDKIKAEPKKYFSFYRCEDFKKNIDVLYECLCCDQKYHLLEQVKEHVRGHFPHVLTA